MRPQQGLPSKSRTRRGWLGSEDRPVRVDCPWTVTHIGNRKMGSILETLPIHVKECSHWHSVAGRSRIDSFDGLGPTSISKIRRPSTRDPISQAVRQSAPLCTTGRQVSGPAIRSGTSGRRDPDSAAGCLRSVDARRVRSASRQVHYQSQPWMQVASDPSAINPVWT